MNETSPPQQNATDNMRTTVIVVAIIAVLTVAGVLLFGSGLSNNSTSSSTEALQEPKKEEEEAYNALVASRAEEADILVIGENCAMSPLVLKLSEGDILTIQNTDDVLHEVTFEDEGIFTVSPNDTRTVDLLGFFKKGEGIYRYRCRDVSNDAVGVLYITE